MACAVRSRVPQMVHVDCNSADIGLNKVMSHATLRIQVGGLGRVSWYRKQGSCTLACRMLPCSASTGIAPPPGSRGSAVASQSTVAHVSAYAITFWSRFSDKNAISCVIFSSPGTTMYWISSEEGVFWFGAVAAVDATATLIWNGLRRPARTSAATASCSRVVCVDGSVSQACTVVSTLHTLECHAPRAHENEGHQASQQRNASHRLRGGEQAGAALARQAGHDRIQLLLEPHLQQPVRLVQHQHLEPLVRQRLAARHQVRDAPGRADDDGRAALDLRNVVRDAGAANEACERAAGDALQEGAGDAVRLRGELARGRDDEREHLQTRVRW